MNKTRILLIGIIVVVVIALVTFLMIIEKPKRDVATSLDAYAMAFKGDNSKLDKLGINTDVAKMVEDFKSNSGFAIGWQSIAVDRAFSEVEISVISVDKNEDGTIDVEYEITSLPVTTLLQTILSNPEKYFSEKSQKVLDNPVNATKADTELLNKELYEIYEKESAQMELHKNTYTAKMTVNKSGYYVLSDDDLNYMINCVVEMNKALDEN